MLRNGAINLVLKIGLIVSSIVFAALSFFQGETIAAYYPSFIVDTIGEIASLIIGSLIAIVMATWLLSRRQRFAAVATYSFLLSLGILFNLNSITFLGAVWPLLCISLALTLRYYPRIRVLAKDTQGQYVMKIIPAARAAILASEEPYKKHTTVIETGSATYDVRKQEVTAPFTENQEHEDVSQKSPAVFTDQFEISHDVESTLEDIFSHAGLTEVQIPTMSTLDEATDDVVHHEPKVILPTDTVKPRTKKKKIVSSHEKEVILPTPIETEDVIPLDNTASIDENPRIARKRVRAKTGVGSKTKINHKKETKQTTTYIDSTPTLEDIEDIQ